MRRFYKVLFSFFALIIFVFIIFSVWYLFIDEPWLPRPYSYPDPSPMIFTYKDYKGDPPIDSPEFYETVKNIGCPTFKTRYAGYSDLKLKILSRIDGEAAYEMYTRDWDGDYLDLAAKNGYLTAKVMIIEPGKNSQGEYNLDEYLKNLKAYEKLSAYATYKEFIKIYSIYFIAEKEGKVFDKRQELIDVSRRLMNINGYLSHSSVGMYALMNLNEPIDKDFSCEYYYRGCMTYETKQDYNIKCEKE